MLQICDRGQVDSSGYADKLPKSQVVFTNPFRRPAEFTATALSPLVDLRTSALSLAAAAKGDIVVLVRTARGCARIRSCTACARVRLILLWCFGELKGV